MKKCILFLCLYGTAIGMHRDGERQPLVPGQKVKSRCNRHFSTCLRLGVGATAATAGAFAFYGSNSFEDPIGTPLGETAGIFAALTGLAYMCRTVAVRMVGCCKSKRS
jgi:hypothetical protein